LTYLICHTPRRLCLDRDRAEAALQWGKNGLGGISKQGDRYLRGLRRHPAMGQVIEWF
jgi:hypothetical protein